MRIKQETWLFIWITTLRLLFLHLCVFLVIDIKQKPVGCPFIECNIIEPKIFSVWLGPWSFYKTHAYALLVVRTTKVTVVPTVLNSPSSPDSVEVLLLIHAAAAAVKLIQSCPTLCDPIDFTNTCICFWTLFLWPSVLVLVYNSNYSNFTMQILFSIIFCLFLYIWPWRWTLELFSSPLYQKCIEILGFLSLLFLSLY